MIQERDQARAEVRRLRRALRQLCEPLPEWAADNSLPGYNTARWAIKIIDAALSRASTKSTKRRKSAKDAAGGVHVGSQAPCANCTHPWAAHAYDDPTPECHWRNEGGRCSCRDFIKSTKRKGGAK